MIKVTIYADCDSDTAESIIRGAFESYKIEIDVSSEDVTRLAAMMGRVGGKSTSERKAAASRANGRRGGRPKKEQER